MRRCRRRGSGCLGCELSRGQNARSKVFAHSEKGSVPLKGGAFFFLKWSSSVCVDEELKDQIRYRRLDRLFGQYLLLREIEFALLFQELDILWLCRMDILLLCHSTMEVS